MAARRWLLAVAALAAASPAAAEPFHHGRITVHGGLEAGTGRYASRLGLGWAIGAEAAWEPMADDQAVGVGLSWSTTWSYYGAGSARISDQLGMLQLAAGARLRVPLGARRQPILGFGLGAALTRTNEAVVVDGDRSYLGPWASFGAQGLVLGRDLWLPPYVGVVLRPLLDPARIDLEVRYVVASGNDGTIGLVLSLSYGS